jgi:predicted nuclease with TOPRIM domain
VTSPPVSQKSKPIKEGIPVVDLVEMGRPFLLPKVVTDKDFLEKNPLQVAAVEKAALLEMDEESAHDQIVDDSTALLRMMERVMVLHEDRSDRRKELEKMRGEFSKLEAENMKLENEVVDLRGKKENRELRDEVAKLEEEKKKLEEEIQSLKLAKVPAEDETENTRELAFCACRGETWLAECPCAS